MQYDILKAFLLFLRIEKFGDLLVRRNKLSNAHVRRELILFRLQRVTPNTFNSRETVKFHAFFMPITNTYFIIMAKFITGSILNVEIENILKNADDTLILISPFIKLHERLISILKTKISNPNLKIFIVFGKNEQNLGKSLRKEDLEFFKEFPNIEIRYEKRLHAKYYANEHSAIISSMNLYSYSQDNNIESGVLAEFNTALNNLSNLVLDKESLDVQASKYFDIVIEQAECIFKKTPVFESKLLGLKKEYKESIIKEDRIEDFFKDSSQFEKGLYKRKFSKTNGDAQKDVVHKEIGYCIRTGIEIPFNPKMPLCEEAYKSWNRYKDDNYPEKFCHYSGEPSNGETTFAKPILKKNWNKAKEKMDLLDLPS